MLVPSSVLCVSLCVVHLAALACFLEVVALATVEGAGRTRILGFWDFGLELLRAIVRQAEQSGMDPALSPSRYIVSTVQWVSTDKGTTTT